MSHFTRIKTKIQDIENLKRALNDLHYQFETGQLNVRGYQGKTEAVELAIRTETNFDIGFRQEGDIYECVADWWGVKLKQEEFLNQVNQRYAYHRTVQELERQGYHVAEEQVTAENVIEMVVYV